jgi:hypothetical protein
MSNPFEIIKDSSMWQNSSIYGTVAKKDPFIRIGIIKKVFRDEKSTDLRYLVEVQDRNDSIEVNARMMRKFGGVYNYEDFTYHGYKISDQPDPIKNFDAKAGDAVVVAFMNGEAREAIILGSLIHPARKSTIDIKNGPQYESEFNGIRTEINKDGEHTVTFKGMPKNLATYDNTPTGKLPVPEYDDKIGTTFLKIDKTGSYEISDNNKEDPGFQNFRIDKPKGTMEFNSGKIRVTLTKKEEKIQITCKLVDINSVDKVTVKTKTAKVEASTAASIKSPKIAIGKEGVELLDQIFKLIEKLGMVKPISPVGPCTPLMATGEWSEVKQIQSKVKEITGSF